MKIAVVGSSGFVGTNIIPHLLKNIEAELYTGFFKSKMENYSNPFFIDITDHKKTFDSLSNINPDLIIHLAAEANVERSEKNPENTFKVNKEGTQNIAQVASKLGCKIIMTSTDFVFPGKSLDMYNESSSTHAVNIEGRSKADAEKILLSILGSDSAIIRISVPYGWKKNNEHKSFLDWVVSSLEKLNKIDLLTDQYNTPTSLLELGIIIEKLTEKWVGGIFHAVAPEVLSRYEFGSIISEIFGFDKSLINPITTEELKGKIDSYKAQRPMYCHLINNRIEKELNYKTRSVKENLIDLKNLKSNKEMEI